MSARNLNAVDDEYGQLFEAVTGVLVSARSDLLGNTTNGFDYASATRLVQQAIDMIDGAFDKRADDHDSVMARDFKESP